MILTCAQVPEIAILKLENCSVWVYESAQTTITKYWIVSQTGLFEEQTFIFSQLWRLEGQDQGARRTGFL